jgi:uncharacterized protein
MEGYSKRTEKARVIEPDTLGDLTMIIGAARVSLFLPDSHSLKEKRGILKSLIHRTQNQFNASVAEVENQDLWQSAVIGIACVTNDNRHADEMVAHVLRFIEGNSLEYQVTEVETEVIYAF